MKIELHAYVLSELQAWKGRWPEVADGSGVSPRTVEKIARQEIKDPGVSHVQKLAAFFQANPRGGTAGRVIERHSATNVA